MLKTPPPAQHELEMVTLEELVPQDHLLRLIERHLRFDFIREQTAHLYCADNGRPALDPVLLFKMLFIGYLFGIRSERQLVREIAVNVAYRWFLGLRLTDKVPDASHAVAEPPPAFRRHRHRAGHLRRHRRAGHRARPGRRAGVLQ
jgi:transposase